MNQRMKKLLTKSGIMLAISGLSFSNLYAETKEQDTRICSEWAEDELHDAMNYGISQIEWYEEYMGEYITKERLSQLCELLSKKLGAIPEVKAKSNLDIKTLAKDEPTKKEVLELMHNILISYEYNCELNFNKDDLKQSMKALEVVKTMDKGIDEKCTTEQAIIMAERIVESMYDLCDADSKGLLWKVQNNGNTVYMLGSIHLANTSIYPMNNKILEAYELSDEVYTEIVYPDEVTEETKNLGKYTDGTTIKDHLSPDYYEKLTKVLKEYDKTPEDFGNDKDWSIMMDLEYLEFENIESEDISRQDVQGIDNYFITDAMRTGKPVKGLEDYYEHFACFDEYMSQESKTFLLKNSIDLMLSQQNLDGAKEEELQNSGEVMLANWKKGDAKALDTPQVPTFVSVLLGKDGWRATKEMQKLVVDDRDEIMAVKIDELLKDSEGKTYFVIAGAAHFVSDTGVITRLEDRGYNIERVE